MPGFEALEGGGRIDLASRLEENLERGDWESGLRCIGLLKGTQHSAALDTSYFTVTTMLLSHSG